MVLENVPLVKLRFEVKVSVPEDEVEVRIQESSKGFGVE